MMTAFPRVLGITIGEEIIREAERRRVEKRGFLYSQDCPIAIAVKAIFPSFEVGVDAEVVVIGGVRGEVYELPDIAKRFALDFDRKRPVRPFSFLLTRRCNSESCRSDASISV